MPADHPVLLEEALGNIFIKSELPVCDLEPVTVKEEMDQESRLKPDLNDQEDSIKDAEVAIIPPDPDEMTDEEGINDELPDESGHQGVAGRLGRILHKNEECEIRGKLCKPKIQKI
ncbi:hypothetical protein FHG87_011837 [Trinorchestia longiramus]|nr:hypothetical protein FHG87_011837 [Trinorchestia longiramus]